MPADAESRSALVTGVTGQDGWYLSELLQASGCQVSGLVTPGDPNPVPDGVVRLAGDMRDAASLGRALDSSGAGIVYHLAAVSSVAKSWADPVLVADVSGLGVARLLSAVHERAERRIRVVNASSAEIFGDPAHVPQSEMTPVAPTNPYGATKAYAHHLVQAFRHQGVWAANVVLFPHESPRRPDTFLSRKVTSTVARIARGSEEDLVLGNLDARRDWGFAGDYVRAMQLVGGADEPGDYVVATGESRSISDLVAAAFAHVGITDWRARVRSSAEFVRPNDATDLRGDATLLRDTFGWQPSMSFEQLVGSMVDADLAALD